MGNFTNDSRKLSSLVGFYKGKHMIFFFLKNKMSTFIKILPYLQKKKHIQITKNLILITFFFFFFLIITGIQAAGAAVVYQIDARKASYRVMFISSWSLLGVGILCILPVVCLRIKVRRTFSMLFFLLFFL